jgi:hypothetical protein
MSSWAGRGWRRSPLLVVRSAEVAGAQGTAFERKPITATAMVDRVLASILEGRQSRTAAMSPGIELALKAVAGECGQAKKFWRNSCGRQARLVQNECNALPGLYFALPKSETELKIDRLLLAVASFM